jgi:hypothetical protein
MKRMPRLHEKPPPARLLMRVTSYPSEHKRIDLRRIPDSCPFAYTALAAPTKHPLTRHNNGRALYCWKQRAQGDETCKSAGHRRSLFLPPRPWVESPFDIHASAGRRFLGLHWSLDPSRRFESKRDPKAGSGEGSVAANWRNSGKAKRSQAFAGPVRASGRIVARPGRSAARHGRAILAKAELSICWPPAQPNAIL